MKKVLANLEEIIVSFFLLLMVCMISFNVVLRVATRQSIPWLEEVSYFCFAWIIFVGASAAYKRSLHGGIDLLVRLFPETARKVVSLLSTFLILLICVVMTFFSFRFAVSAGSKVTPILYISYFWVDLSAVVGFGMMCVHSLGFIKNLFLHQDYYRSKPLYSGILDYDTVMGGVSEDETLQLHVEDRAEPNGGEEKK